MEHKFLRVFCYIHQEEAGIFLISSLHFDFVFDIFMLFLLFVHGVAHGKEINYVVVVAWCATSPRNTRILKS